MATYPATPVFDPASINARIKLPTGPKKSRAFAPKSRESSTYMTSAGIIAAANTDDQTLLKLPVSAPIQIRNSMSLPADTYNMIWLLPDEDIIVHLPSLANTVKGACSSWRNYGPGNSTIKTSIDDGEEIIAILAPDQTLLMASDYGMGPAGQWRIILGPTGTIGGGNVNGPTNSTIGAIASYADSTGRLLANSKTCLNDDGSIRFLSDIANTLNLIPINTGISPGNWYLRNGVNDNVVGTATTDTLSHKTIIDVTNNITANSLRTDNGGSINISSGSAPTAGQILTAINSTTAIWQDPVADASAMASSAAATTVISTRKVNVIGTFTGSTPNINLRCLINCQVAHIELSAGSCATKGRLKIKSGAQVLDANLPATNANFAVIITVGDSYETARFTLTTTGHIELCSLGPATSTVTIYSWDNINVSYLLAN